MMPTLDGAPLLDAPADDLVGFAYMLDRPSRTTTCVRIALDSVEYPIAVILTARSSVVVARARRGSSTAWQPLEPQFGEAVERALDLVSVQGGESLRTKSADRDFAVFSHDDGNWWLRLHKVTTQRNVHVSGKLSATFRFRVSVSTNRELEPAAVSCHPGPGPSDPRWIKAYRYWRASQTTGDITEAYRNLYLACEHALSLILPKQGGEGQWLDAVLPLALARVDLPSLVVSPGTNRVARLKRMLYADLRNGVFHSKENQPVILPLSHEHREQVKEAYWVASELFLGLARADHGLARSPAKSNVDDQAAQVFRWLTASPPRVIVRDRTLDMTNLDLGTTYGRTFPATGAATLEAIIPGGVEEINGYEIGPLAGAKAIQDPLYKISNARFFARVLFQTRVEYRISGDTELDFAG